MNDNFRCFLAIQTRHILRRKKLCILIYYGYFVIPGGIFPSRFLYRSFCSESFVTRIPVLDDLWLVQSGSSADLILLRRDVSGGIRGTGLSTSLDRSSAQNRAHFPAAFPRERDFTRGAASSRVHRTATRPTRIREPCNHQSVM